MKSEKLIRAYERALPSEEKRLGILYAVLRENRSDSASGRRNTMKRKPVWRTILIAAAITAILAALTAGGYAAVKKWSLPAPETYAPTQNGSVDVHDTVIYREEDLESSGTAAGTEAEMPSVPSDTDLIRKAITLLQTLGMENVKSEEMTVTHQTQNWYPREETEIRFERDEIRTSITYNSETGKFLKLDGFDSAMLPGESCADEDAAAACARSFYEKLPVEQGYVLTPMVEKYDDDLWMYEFCREVEPGLYNDYEMVRLTINPETGRLVMVNVFFFPLLDDHGEEPALTEEEAIARVEARFNVSGFRLVDVTKRIVLPNWWWDEANQGEHLRFARVTRWAWVIRYQAPNSMYTYDDAFYVDLYTGEILGGDSVG